MESSAKDFLFHQAWLHSMKLRLVSDGIHQLIWDSAISGVRIPLQLKVLHLGTRCKYKTTRVLIIAQTVCVCVLHTQHPSSTTISKFTYLKQ